MKIEVLCGYCNKIFLRERSKLKNANHHYCSHKCFINSTKGIKRPNVSKKLRKGKFVECDMCSNGVYRSLSELKNHTFHFCSRECQYEFMSTLIGINAPQYKGKINHYICEWCNKEFESYEKSRTYCSKECMAEGYKQPKINMICDFCNEEYKVVSSVKKWSTIRKYEHNFCSKKCQHKFHQGENHPVWIGDRTKLKDQNKSIRWSKKMSEWRRIVFERDGYSCKICHDKSSKGHPVEINGHHIKSFKDYPEERFNPDNGITLCRKCHIWVHTLNPLDFQ